jgi:glycosyltransferase involved in cell wall biosynthesis
MKVAMVYELFWPSPGGIESWIGNVSKNLSKKGFEVTILTSKIRGPAFQSFDGITVRHIDNLGLMKKMYIPGSTQLSRQIFWGMVLMKYLTKHSDEFNILHSHVQASFLGSLLAKGRSKVIFHWHGTYHEWFYKMYSFLVALGYDIMEHVAIHLPYDACITADEYTKKLAIEHMHANPSKIFPVTNGVNTKLFRPLNVAPEDVGWEGDGPFIIAARRLVTKNGLQFLIPAMKKLVRILPEAKLMIYGSGPLESYLTEMIKKFSLEQNVFFNGSVAHSDLPKYYSAADVVTVPSLIEATSLGCLEAMACAKPLLTCPVGGVPEIFATGCGVLAEPGNVQDLFNKLKYLLCESNDKDRVEMGKIGRKNVEKKYTWEKTTENVIKVYKKVLELES